MKPAKADQLYMDIAYRIASESYCKRRQVGAVIVTADHVTLCGYNGTVSGFDNVCELEDGSTSPYTLHAETNALSKALLAGVSTKNATCYVTLSPCVECAKMLIQAGITRVVYAEQYRCTKGIELLEKACIVLQLEVKNDT